MAVSNTAVTFASVPAGANFVMVRIVGNDVRMSWLDIFAWPMKDPAAARIVHEECVRAAEPNADAAARSRELAPNLKVLNEMFVEAPADDVPTMVDGRPTQGADSTTSG
jgi:hypothetical protein